MSAPRRRRASVATLLSRLILIAGVAGVGTFAAGFGWFAETVTTMQQPSVAPKADGVAALTGGSDARLRAAVTLVETGKAKRLLISGVNAAATAEEVRLVSGGSRALHACCVALGRTAADTIGNAREIKAWTQAHGLRSVIVVTDTYHIPRAMLEIRHALPGVTLIAWPVRDGLLSSQQWWQDERATRALALEYGKYLVVMGRVGLGLTKRETDMAGSGIGRRHSGLARAAPSGKAA